MTALLVLAAVMDAALVVLIGQRAMRSWERGLSLRLRIFFALAAATLLGALATGLYATAVDAETLGFTARFARVAPKGFLLASGLLPLLAGSAAVVGARLARPVEELSEAAARMAEGGPATTMRSGRGAEAQKLARALTSMRREIEGRPYAAAFLRDAWHDLKTPVAAINATLEVLEDGALEDRDAARRFLANLRRSADQLDRRLQDLITLARYETAAVQPAEAADVRALVLRAIEAHAPLAEARRVTVSVDAGPPVRAAVDAAALVRALGNLLENALRASPGGEVRVEVDDTVRGVVGLSVANAPASVSADLRGRLFLRSATGEPGHGTGLGLAIARAAVEAHGGTVRFTELGPPRVTVRIELPR